MKVLRLFLDFAPLIIIIFFIVGVLVFAFDSKGVFDTGIQDTAEDVLEDIAPVQNQPSSFIKVVIEAEERKSLSDSNVVVSDLEKAFEVCVIIESNGDYSAQGDNGQALGMVQIWRCVVDDVNRIIGYDAYHYNDRLSPEKSWEIFFHYLTHYAADYQQRSGCSPSIEIYARLWNGGPYKKKFGSYDWWWEDTDEYWQRAQRECSLADNIG